LKELKSRPDINNYLTYLTITRSPINNVNNVDLQAARSAAALMLKNQIQGLKNRTDTGWKAIADQSKTYIKGRILEGLKDSDYAIRTYTGLVVTTIVHQGGLMEWTQSLTDLVAIVETSDNTISTTAQDGAMSALLKICEDNKVALKHEYNGERPVETLIPKFLTFASHPNSKVRWQALAAINVFVYDKMPDIIQVDSEAIIQCLFPLASDTDEDVRKQVCQLFSSMATFFPEQMIPYFEDVVTYLLARISTDPDSRVALDAAEFFFQNSDSNALQGSFHTRLHKIIPVLLGAMRYNTENQERLEGEAEEDAEQEDRTQDIKPQFAKSNDKGVTVKETNGHALGDDSDGEVDDDGDEDPEEEWNLRKCSAATLDYFAGKFHESVFQATLPYLKENLQHPAWVNREAAVLILGAIAEGCMEVVKPNLPDLVPYLISLLDDKTPIVRTITCWTLGRYSAWSAHLDDVGKKQFFEPIMDGLLKRMLDKNKKVQRAASSAFTALENEAKEALIPYGLVIAQQYVKCFTIYKDRNLYSLYDSIEALSENLGSEMSKPAMVETLMPVLLDKWRNTKDESKEMIPLLECLSYLAHAMGSTFAPFAEPFFHRCIKIISDNLEQSNRAVEIPGYDEPDKDFLITSLDMLSSILHALHHVHASEIVKATQPNMFELLCYCMRDSDNGTKQSAYALLGDSASNTFDQFRPYLQPLMKIAIMSLDVEAVLSQKHEDHEPAFRVINNSIWAIGEISIRSTALEMQPFATQLLEKLGIILFHQKVLPEMNENSAVAIGRVASTVPETFAPHLSQLAPTLLRVLQRSEVPDEKASAIQGLTKMATINPQGLEQCLAEFLTAVGAEIAAGLTPPQGFEVVSIYYGKYIYSHG